MAATVAVGLLKHRFMMEDFENQVAVPPLFSDEAHYLGNSYRGVFNINYFCILS